MRSARLGDAVRVAITPAIQEAAIALLSEVIGELHGIWPELSGANLRLAALNVLVAYWQQQQNGGDPVPGAHIITFPIEAEADEPEPAD
jgi:hypothetical protein